MERVPKIVKYSTWVTPGSDPVQVQVWTFDDGTELEEFFGDYFVKIWPGEGKRIVSRDNPYVVRVLLEGAEAAYRDLYETMEEGCLEEERNV